MIYARSTAQSVRQLLEIQLDSCRQYCRNKGYDVLSEWTDIGSGVDDDRQGLKGLMDAVAAENPAVIVLTSLDNQWC